MKQAFFTTAQIKEASNVSIIEYIQAKGIGVLTPQGSNYVKLKYDGHDSLVIDVKRNFFIHNSNQYEENAKGNLINFIRYMSGNQKSFREAIAEALEFKGEHVSAGQFVLPEKKPFEYDFVQAKYNSRGKNYLVKERQIDAQLVDWLFEKGYIMQEAKYNNLVFNWTRDGKPPENRDAIIGATQQTTQPPREGQPSKWIKESSQSEMGFNVQLGNKTNTLYVFEASIDLLSYWSIHKERLQNCRLVSLEGLKERTFYQFLDQSYQANPEGVTVHICVDNDLAALKFVNHLMQPKEGSPILYQEDIPHYTAIRQIDAQQLKEACQQYEVDYAMVASVYMIERHFLEKSTEKEREMCCFKNGISQGVASLQTIFIHGFKEGLTQLSHDFLMRERIEQYYSVFQAGEIQEVLEVQKDWNDFYRYAYRVQEVIPEKMTSPMMEHDRPISQSLSKAQPVSPQNVVDYVKTKTVRLTDERVKEVAACTMIDEKIIEIFAQKGWIRETKETDELVFVWSHKGEVKGAEKLTQSNHLEMISGSRLEHAFTFTVGQTKAVCVFDSPLEALSFLNLYPDTSNTTFICCHTQHDLFLLEQLQEGFRQGEIHQVSLCTSRNASLYERLQERFSLENSLIRSERKQTMVHMLEPLTDTWQEDVKGYKEYCKFSKLEKDIDQQLDHLKKVSPSQEVTQANQQMTLTISNTN